MNNQTIKTMIGGLIGAGVGFLIGDWYYVNYIYEEPYTLDPIEKFNERLKKVVEPKELKAKKKVKATNYTEHFKPNDLNDLNELAKKYRGEEDFDPGEQELLEGENEIIEMGLQEDNEIEDTPIINADPSIISIVEYANNDEYEHTTLHYYEDDVLTDEDGAPIDNPEKFLGDEALISFGELSQDADTVYVRNRKFKAMYEVVRLNKPYSAPVQRSRRRPLSRQTPVLSDSVDVVEDSADAEEHT